MDAGSLRVALKSLEFGSTCPSGAHSGKWISGARGQQGGNRIVISATSSQEASSWLPGVVRTLSEVYFRIHYFGRTSHRPHLEICSNTGSVDTTVWASLQRAEEAAVQYSCVVVKGYFAWFYTTDGCF